MSDRLGGHLVSGHVTGSASDSLRAAAAHRLLRVRAPRALARYIARKGSITVHGVSLTVNAVRGAEFEVNLIPHTLAVTTLRHLRTGDRVNLESGPSRTVRRAPAPPQIGSGEGAATALLMGFSPAEIERRALAPHPEFPPELPICTKREEIAKAISSNQVVIVCGETARQDHPAAPDLSRHRPRHPRPYRAYPAAQDRRARHRHPSRPGAEDEPGGPVGYKDPFHGQSRPALLHQDHDRRHSAPETQGDRELRQYDTLTSTRRTNAASTSTSCSAM